MIISLLVVGALSASAQKSGFENNAAVLRLTKAYPNPATTYLNVELIQTSNIGDYSLCLFNMLGKKVYAKNNLSPRTTIDLNGYFRGNYYFQLKDRRTGQVLESGKIIVSN